MKEILSIIRFTSRLKWLYIGIAICGTSIALLAQVAPFLTREIIDRAVAAGVDENQFSTVIGFIVAIFIIDLIITLIENVNGHIGDRLSIRIKELLSKRYYDKLLHLPQRYFDEQHTGTIIGRLERSITNIANFFKQVTNLFFATMLSAFVSLLVIAYYAWPLAVLTALLFPLYLYLTMQSSKVWRGHEEKILANQDSANGRFAESVTQIRVVKAFAQQDQELKHYSAKFTAMIAGTIKQSLQWQKYDIARKVSQNAVLAVYLLVIVQQTFAGNFTIGELTLLMALVVRLQQPLRFISFFVDNMQRMMTASRDYFAVLDEADEDAELEAGTEKFTVTDGAITFDAVSFKYSDDETMVLKDISFEIKPGQKLALVGESGEGKSTIAHLLLRLYDVEKGVIAIDGQDIAKAPVAAIRKSIGAVFQEPALFSGTIASNIAYGVTHKVTQEQIETAAKTANAHDFISKLPNGYKSEIGERGVKLSGGQKQRIAIARAVLLDPPILLLDEATSALDSRAEAEVQKALERLMKGRTSIIIAHRLSTIAGVDTIVTLKKGQVDEIGSPTALAKTDGIYAELLSLQQHVSTDDELREKYEIAS